MQIKISSSAKSKGIQLVFKNMLIIVLLLFLNSCKKHPESKEAILLISFGSTYPLPEQTYNQIEEQVQQKYPQTHIEWAYTSNAVRRVLKKRGINKLSPLQALDTLKAQGYNTIYTQSLHIIPGHEFDQANRILTNFAQQNKNIKITLGQPLLNTPQNISHTAQIVANIYKDSITNNHAVVLMAHGSSHQSNNVYQQLQTELVLLNHNIFIATVEDTDLSLDTVMEQLKLRNITQVELAPLMCVSGDHATNDMAGGYPIINPEIFNQSWNGILSQNGFSVTINIKALGDYQPIVDCWLQNLEKSKTSELK